MTNASSSSGLDLRHGDLEADILAALWEEVPFPRLPYDAPPELRALVVEIENPKRVYSIHRATRRHGLQLLIEKFIAQLRDGCGCIDCPTASCFSCRRRLAGKAPIRRYSPMSARTLAIHMANQDNPEQYLCPKLRLRSAPNDAIKPLIFGPKPRLPRGETGDSRRLKRPNGIAKENIVENLDRVLRREPVSAERSTSKAASAMAKRSQAQRNETKDGQEGQHAILPSDDTSFNVSINERPIRKDYRSFAANMFGTVTFKMLEWLAPNNLEAISEKAAAALETRSLPSVSKDPLTVEESDDELFVTSTSSVDMEEVPTPAKQDQNLTHEALSSQSINAASSSSDVQRRTSLNGNANGGFRPVQSRTNSHTRLRTASKTKSLSADYVPEVIIDDSVHLTIPPISTTSKRNKSVQGVARSSSKKTRQQPVEQLTNGAADEHEVHPSQSPADRRSQELQDSELDDFATLNNGCCLGTPSIADTGPRKSGPESEMRHSVSDADILPHSISHLSHETVDFLCDVLQQDGTTESHMLEPQSIATCKRSNKSKVLRRRKTSHNQYPRYLKLEWKLFAEQSIFNVLSNPFAILESFTNSDGLIESHTLWYHMLRMTRVAPTLVFDSLWQASATLFAPPKALKSTRSPTASFFPKHVRSLSNEEAGFLISVCFHALVAAAPIVHSSAQLFDMSRIRSRGTILSDPGSTASTTLCLQYEDAFMDDMAIRLARRILAAISTRKYFDDLAELNAESQDAVKVTGVLDVLLAHLEPGREVQALTELPYTEREVHEKRVPILLLDWARTIMLNEWQGRPDVPGDGPFGGALTLIAAMCKLLQFHQ